METGRSALMPSILPLAAPDDVVPTERPQSRALGTEQRSRAAEASQVPLVVDLDHSLLRANLLLETIIAFLKPNPFRIIVLCHWLLAGPRQLAQRLARSVGFDIGHVPVDATVVTLANEAEASGRPVYLLTSLPPAHVGELRNRFRFVTGILPRRGTSPLSRSNGDCRLGRVFSGGYELAVGRGAGLSLWRVHPAARSVERRPRGGRRAGDRVSAHLEVLKALVESARPHQWLKNVLVFVPVLLGGLVDDADAITAAILAFLAIGLVASATYIVNDAVDVAADRRHWSKCRRPIAAGRVGLGTALVAACGLMAAGFAVSTAVGGAATVVLIAYVAGTLAYSLALKRWRFVDCGMLAGLFTMRLALGVAAVNVTPSVWLFAFSMAFFTSLALAKRYTEVRRASERGIVRLVGRGYRSSDRPSVLHLGWLAGFSAAAIVTGYILEDAFRSTFYGDTTWLWGFPPLIMLFLCRIWWVALEGKMNDDPIEFAIRDGVTRVLLSLLVVCFAFAWMG